LEQSLGRNWRSFLDAPSSIVQAHPMNLYKDVLATESGGQAVVAVDPPHEMAACIRAASHFYTLTFNPPVAAQIDDYHTLRVRTAVPGATASTNTGYYDQPWYTDQLPAA